MVYVDVVVVKAGPEGAWVLERGHKAHIPALRTEIVWTIGTGDVFAGVFGAQWGVHGRNAVEAENLASGGVASYVDTMALPVPKVDELAASAVCEVGLKRGKVYLAAPFFCVEQRWIVDEARRYLSDFGMTVFSPVGEIGHGPVV